MSSQMTDIELLKLGDQGRIKPFLNIYWSQIIGVSLGVGAAAYINFQTRRPPFSGIQKHIILSGVFTGALMYVSKKREEYYAEKDAVYRHYIELHPEDFPIPGLFVFSSFTIFSAFVIVYEYSGNISVLPNFHQPRL